MYVNQKDLQVQADTWSLAIVIFEFMVCSQLTGAIQDQALKELKKLREMNYTKRVEIIRLRVQDVAMQELLCLMLRDQNERPMAE